ncbi:Flp family type IVb pilin [Sphingomonas sp. KC8]|uniref:Flp family type IVb pilin n=1 Tax=Sphingomonas sp. KC8 TaxID=1030157 RepID=UPI0002489FAC|nr:pilus assembly protein [Sphingomonas sp. KC8]ARS26539.1 hypothetical protein KC8_04450 [Sphingomonas sp. KC8]
MRKFFDRLLADRTGASALEYSLIIALVVIAMLVALNGFASTTINMWDNVTNKVVNA